MSQRTWQSAASPPGSRQGGLAGLRESGQPGLRASGPPSPAGQRENAQPGAPAPAAGLSLTGRGAMLGIFALCFLGVVASGWLHWGMLAGMAFVAASVLGAARTQRAHLLTVAVSQPALFLVALVCGKVLTSSGGLLSTAEGTLITLTNTAPWLLAGTVLGLIIAFARGLWSNVRALSAELRGDPTRNPGGVGQRRPL